MSDGHTSVRTAAGSYTIHLGLHVLGDLPEILRQAAPAARYVIISDETVAPLHGEPTRALLADAGMRCDLLRFPAGEGAKTRATWSALTDAMLELGVGRDGCVIAVGGGVTGDVAGFVAATYLRGVPVVQVPTSLLAMIDASVGGKTGVDTPHGKNLVGAFHQPRAVVVDPETLETLPAAEFRAGLAEAVKHGCIADRDYLAWIEDHADRLRDPTALPLLIGRSIGIKAGFVEADERESGRRTALNFGHTVGHAIETVTGYAVRHGQAVAAGMAAEAALGVAAGVSETGTTEVVEGALRAVGLPTRPPEGIAAQTLVDAARADKKRRSDVTRYTLLERPGAVARTEDGAWTFGLEPVRVREVLDRWLADAVD